MDDGGISPWTFHLPQEGEERTRRAHDESGGPFEGHDSVSADEEQQQEEEEEEEEDICRVCRGEATADMPLMHPWYGLIPAHIR